MRLGIIAVLTGILVFHSLPELPESGWGAGLSGLMLVALAIPLLRLLGLALAGFIWALLWVSPGQMQLPEQWESVDLEVEGWVLPIPETFYRSARFYLAVDSLRQADVSIPFRGRLRLSWYEDPPALRVGDRWVLTVRLKRPRGLANPGAFDYERWLFINDVNATGYVRQRPEPQLLKSAERYPIGRFRQDLLEAWSQRLAGNPYAGILIALAVGERQAITQDQWQVFTRTGTSHLMAISGLHVGLIAGLVFILVWRLWACCPPLTRCWPAGKTAALAALASAAAYALLAGLSLPTQRAFIMIAVLMLALLGQRAVVSSRILALALLLVLVLDPSAPLSGGFWLSFGAVAAILYTVTGRIGEASALRQWLSLQVVILLALLPATLLWFQSIALLAPVANLIAIPWASISVVPLTLLAVLAGFVSETLQAGLLELAALTMDWLWRFLRWLERLPWSLIRRPSPPAWTLIFALPGLLLLLAPRGLPGRWLGGLLCLPLLFFPLAAPAPGGFWFTLLDVGQGLAAVVRTRQHIVVYDTGPRLGPRFDAGRAALVPFLRAQGIARVDTLVISHGDSQHTGGVRSLLERLPVERVITSSLQQVPIEGAVQCRAGDLWNWDGVWFRLLHPPEKAGFSGDNASCVLAIEGPGGRVLLTGDIEVSGQAAMLGTYGNKLAADILVAPHHGNRSGVLKAFVSAVDPRYVLFSTGYRNRFAYPKSETLNDYEGRVVLNTVHHGALTFRFDSGGVRLIPESQRQQARHYWNTP